MVMMKLYFLCVSISSIYSGKQVGRYVGRYHFQIFIPLVYVGPLTTNFSTQFFSDPNVYWGTVQIYLFGPKLTTRLYASSKLFNFILPEEMEDLLMWKEYDRVHLSLQKPLKTQNCILWQTFLTVSQNKWKSKGDYFGPYL